MKLLQNKKAIIAIVVIVILLGAIVGTIYGIYSNNKEQTIAEPMDEKQKEIEKDKNIVDINNIEETTREYN